MGNDKIIFIVGSSRSGTTMLGRVFGKSSQVHTFGELHFFEQMINDRIVSQRNCWDDIKLVSMLERLITSARDGLFSPVSRGRYSNDAKIILSLCTEKDPVSVYERFLREETKKNGKCIPCEQTPRYLYASETIFSSFPEAYIINLVRDPRDVLLSQKNKWRRRFLGAKNIPIREAFRAWVNYHPYTISKLWVSSVQTAQSLEKHPRFFSLQFESLLNNPEGEIRRLCDFVGLAYEPNMLEVPQVGSSAGADDHSKIGIDHSKASGWSKGGLSKVELYLCQRVTAQEMKRLGYKVSPVSVAVWLRWLNMVTFILKISMALLFNLKRSKSMIGSIRRRLIKPNEKMS